MRRSSLPRASALAALLVTASLVPPFAVADGEARHGSFEGVNDHATSGEVTLESTADGYRVVLGDDFSFDGAPDPKIALGKGGEVDTSTLMGLLESNSGTQSFTVPPGVDPSAYDEVHLWCEKYSVGLGIAPLR